MNGCLCQTRVNENDDAFDSSTVACSEEHFFSDVIDGVESVGSSLLGLSDDACLILFALMNKSSIEKLHACAGEL
ncbi:unnamed protein product [Angiostrongylus costaricensis]|uniref:Uncharacterized protein n=1 Tax=Angiostrongylus costaricensis TaxID=334426 RepID=A0A0R3P9G8_ANGCS|nr:unnamed protein product [Angiostrongylus costaricensis]